MKIDSHHHFWNYETNEYQWIGDGMEVLKKNFGPAELEANLKAAGLDGAISVQARTNAVENKFLIAYAKQHDFIKAVVGYVDLTATDAHQQLQEFAGLDQKAVGIREVLQGKSDDAYCLRKDFNQGVSLLNDFGLIYDILILHRHLPNAIQFVDQHALQVFVLDHIAKPSIQDERPSAKWASDMIELGKRENVYVKISGMVTEVTKQKQWTPEMLKPYFETAWEAFGSKRIMFGSDWPVCLLRSDYLKWVAAVESWTDELTETESNDFWGQNAARAYGLSFVKM